MFMHPPGLWRLARLARDRKVPEVLEKLATSRTGTNPVLTAIEATEARTGQKRSVLYSALTLSTSLSVLALAVSIVGAHQPDLSSWVMPDLWSWLMIVGVAVMVCIILGAVVALILSVVSYDQPRKERVEEADIFDSDLARLSDWSGVEHKELRVDAHALKAIARRILVDQAKLMFRHKRDAEHATAKAAIQDSKGLEDEAFDAYRQREVVLVRLGIASPDRRKYFDLAESQLDAEEAQLAESTEAPTTA